MIAALFALGCGTSPIAAVVSDEAISQAGSSGSPVDVTCHVPGPGRFILSGENGCLRRAEGTTVFGAPAYAIELSADCTSERAQWQLTPAEAGSFRLLNVEADLWLDVRAGSDVPGTPIILFDPNNLDNQRFWLRPRADDAYELSPRHAPALCAEARQSEVEIWACEPDNGGQNFHFSRVECP